MARKRKTGQKIAIGGIVVQVNEDIDGSGDNYEVVTQDQVSGMPFFPRTRGRTAYEHCTLFIWDVFEDTNGSRLSTYVNMWVMILIVASALVGAFIETNPPIHKEEETTWFWIEAFFIANFSIEFVLRVSCTPSCKEFWSQGMNYVDLIAILPFYLKLSLGGGGNVGFLRVLRLGRAFRLVKMGKYSQGIRLVTNALAKSVDALQLFCFLLILVLVVFSAGEYYFERGEWVEENKRYYRDDPNTGQRESDESVFQSIPQSFWWCIVTLTTVGYGDYYPYTDLGKVFAVITMLVGLVMLALPLSIIGTNFIEERAIMNAENEYDNKAHVDCTTPILPDLEYCLAQAESLKMALDSMNSQIDKAQALLQEGHSLEQSHQINPLMHQEDTNPAVDDDGLYSLSADQVEQLLKYSLEVLATSTIQKDIWVDRGHGLDHLPELVRDRVAPLVEGSIK